MRDGNSIKMVWIGVVAILLFGAGVASQLHGGQSDRQAKSTACREGKRSYAQASSRPLQSDVRTDQKTSDAEQRKQAALQYDVLIDATAVCTAASIANAGLDPFYAVLLRTLPSVFGGLALLVAGLRYDADRRQMLGGRQVRLDFAPDGRSNPGGWVVRNLSGGTQVIEAFEVLRFPSTGGARTGLAGLELLQEVRAVTPAGSTTFESTLRSGDLLVAARVRGADGETVICWARFDAHGNEMRKKEEGRLL